MDDELLPELYLIGTLCRTFPSNVAPLANVECCVVIGQCHGSCTSSICVLFFDVGVGATCASNATLKVPNVSERDASSSFRLQGPEAAPVRFRPRKLKLPAAPPPWTRPRLHPPLMSPGPVQAAGSGQIQHGLTSIRENKTNLRRHNVLLHKLVWSCHISCRKRMIRTEISRMHQRGVGGSNIPILQQPSLPEGQELILHKPTSESVRYDRDRVAVRDP